MGVLVLLKVKEKRKQFERCSNRGAFSCRRWILMDTDVSDVATDFGAVQFDIMH